MAVLNLLMYGDIRLMYGAGLRPGPMIFTKIYQSGFLFWQKSSAILLNLPMVSGAAGGGM